ncbi:hypothetical protein ATO10_04452 [Actibacterium atlanticum]|uniref:Uncharacterized protein n=1 Tax=Actibacterium atlanticum TaxID=1461693 RepID=A0A058ZNN3_9RHOB|nr:hypothetical protein [Actibacterium atlanticum]KCV82830.1 hypothetical protein ATO10_04452 [Actibacterium atlanticum]
MTIDSDLFVWAVKSLNGEITREMRLVALRAVGRKYTFRYYLDREPTDFVREQAEIVAVNFDAGLLNIEELNIEFVKTSEPLGKLDNLDAALFRRWENDKGGVIPNP